MAGVLALFFLLFFFGGTFPWPLTWLESSWRSRQCRQQDAVEDLPYQEVMSQPLFHSWQIHRMGNPHLMGGPGQAGQSEAAASQRHHPLRHRSDAASPAAGGHSAPGQHASLLGSTCLWPSTAADTSAAADTRCVGSCRRQPSLRSVPKPKFIVLMLPAQANTR